MDYRSTLCHLTFLFILFQLLNAKGSRRKYKNGDIRLVGGGQRWRGTVLVLKRKKWSAICDDMWGLNDAIVVCRQLGYKTALQAPIHSKYGPGVKRKWITQVQCLGTEKRLSECKSGKRQTGDSCKGFKSSAGVWCTRKTANNTTTTSAPSSGSLLWQRLQRYRSRQQRTRTNRPTSTTTIISTKPSNPLTITTMHPSTPTTPAQTRTTMKTTTTTTTETTPTTTTTKTTTTTETTTKHIMSDLEEEIAAWAANQTNDDGDVLYTTAAEDNDGENINNNTTTTDEEQQHIIVKTSASQNHKKSDAPAIIDEEDDEDNEERDDEKEKKEKEKDDISKVLLSSAQTRNKTATELLKEEAVESIDFTGQKKRARLEMERKQQQADDPPNTELEVRVKGGRYNFEGRLEVREKDGEWGVICSDHWSLREVLVACRQVGGIGKGKQPLKYSYFGGSKMPKLIHRVQCVGRENALHECNITKTTEADNKCSKFTSVAGVVCSDNLPDLVPSLKALQASARLQDQPLFYLRCSMEENCLADSAYVIRNTSEVWRNNIRRLFRFSTVVHNRGIADFNPYRAKNQWEWHACHMHYHSMEVFAHYDIMDSEGNRLASGSKASFCLEDTVCDKGTRPKYNCRGLADQGLSVNCSDNYMYDIDCQWIDITDIKPGSYTFMLEVNPELLVAETTFENNVVQCNMHYNGYYASLKNCEHQSLLDYRRPLKRPPPVSFH